MPHRSLHGRVRTMESPLSATSSGLSSDDERRGSGARAPCRHVPQPGARTGNYELSLCPTTRLM
jgi:hypothetical protein